MPGAGRGDLCDEGLGAHGGRSCGSERLLPELAERVVAALEQLARDRYAGAASTDPLLGFQVVLASGLRSPRRATCAASYNAHRNAGGPCREMCPGARR